MLGSMIHAFGDKVPRFGPDVFVHPDATVIGDVVLEEGASVWPGAVLRGDVEQIVVGAFTSFQDGAIAHADPGTPLRVGSGCAIGHGAILHGCTVGDGCLVGMHATLLNGCVVGEQSMVGAQTLVPQDRTYPPRSLLVGSPARAVRELTGAEMEHIAWARGRYAARGKLYTEQGFGADLSAFRG
jgi:carbonic anhydrase/acetyltransferase-like protein (isoleucine patch superfamily)